MADRCFKILTNLATSAVIARYLQPEGFGTLSYILSLVTLFAAFANLGFDEIIVRRLVESEDDHPRILGSALSLRIISSIIGIVCIMIASVATEPSADIRWMTLLVSSGILFQASNVVDLYFQSKVLSKYTSITNICQQATSTLIKIALVYYKAPIFAFAVAYFLDFFLQSIGLIIAFRVCGMGFRKWKHDLSLVSHWVKAGLPLAISTIITSVYVRIDQVMIKSILGVTMVGQYAVTISLTEVWYFIPLLICQSLFPAIVRSKSSDPKIYYDRLQKLTDLLFTIALFLSIFAIFLAEPTIRILYGDKYLPAISTLKINIWSTVFVFIGSVSSKWLVVEGYFSKNLARITAGIISKILLNLVLIHYFSITGAAIATLSAHFIASYLYDFIDRDCRQMFKIKTKSFFFLPRYLWTKAS